jgi:DNA-binding SARP family transcriptional activator/predicted ATPase
MSKKLLKIELLGNVRFTVDGKPVTDLPTRKAEALLIYLVCHRRAFAREVLADLLWDDRPQDQALANLRSILSSLRRSFDPYLTITRQSVAFNHESNYEIDVAEFERGLDQGTGRELAQTAGLYRGDFLEGFYLRDSLGFEEWALMERERLQRSAVGLLWQLIEESAAQGEYRMGLGYVDQLLRADNLSERAHRQKMLFLARMGQYNAALNHFETCRQILDEELGVDPAPETVALCRRIQDARDVEPPHLPPPPPHFLGREQEQAELQDLLRSPTARLITVLGAGGMGKSRLAIESVRDLLVRQPGQFLHGAYFAPLAGLNSPQLLPSFLAQILGAEVGDQEPSHVVMERLTPRESLLLLDNFEPFLEQADWLGELLAAAPQLKLLVTSQEPLRLQEEWILDLDGLETPQEEITVPEQAERFSALRLFLRIAQRFHPRYQSDAADLAAISRICRLLRGMPLGIELAAVWIRQFSPDQMAQEIEQGLDFLATNLRNVPDRHRSLRAAFDYAWRLLPAEVQCIFARLALFQGGFTSAAALAVAGARAEDLALLVDKSLLRLEEGRYDMHPMLNRFAREQLAQDPPQAQAASQAHTLFFFDFLAQQGEGEEPAQRQAIQAEMLNVRTAWYRAGEEKDLEAIYSVAPIMHGFYSAQSWFQDGIDDFRHVLDALPQGSDLVRLPAQVRFDLLGRVGRMHLQIGQLDAASQALDEAMNYFDAVENPARRSAVLGYRAIIAFYRGKVDEAIELTQQGLLLDEEVGAQDGIAFGLNYLGTCYKSLGEYGLAREYFQRSVDLYKEMGDELGQAMTLNNLGNLAQAQGELETAHDYYLTCSRLFQAQNHIHGAATTLSNAGRLSRKMGNLAEAETLLQQSLSLKQEMQDERGVAVALVGLADVAVAAGDGSRARAYLSEALTLAHNTGDVKLTLEGLAVWGALRRQESADPMPGARLLAYVLAHPALAQEVRDQVEKTRESIAPKIWESAAAWATAQTLDELVHSAAAGM